MDIHPSARRHGVEDEDILHAVDHALVVIDLDPDADPPRLLVIGPDRAANMLEVILLELINDEFLAIHAMALRTMWYPLLPTPEDG